MSNDDNASGSATKDPPGEYQPPALYPPPITVYKARRPRKGFGWKRMLLWTFGTIIVVAIGVAGVTTWFVYDRLEKVTTLGTDPDLQSVSKHLDALPINTGAPVNVLVLGYDHRSWEKNTNSRSDTMILMRLDPQKHTLTTISMPRDMKVDIPGYGPNKINAAYSFGGATLALATVRQLLNVKINYLITVNFTGFRRVVDDVGGVYIDVERRYYNQNGQPGSGDYTNIDLKAGYQKLNGVDSLAYVRFRHQDSDIFRLARQQQFLRELKHKLDLTTVGVNFVSLVTDVSNNVKIVSQYHHQPGPNTLISYARALAKVPRSRTLQIKLLGDQGAATGGQFVEVGQPEITTAVQNFLSPDFAQTNAAANVGGKRVGPGTTTKKTVPPIAPKKLKVITLNGSGVDLASATAATALRNVGYTHAIKGILDRTHTGNTVRQNFETTTVYYTSARAKTAAKALGIALFDANVGPAPKVYMRTKPLAQVVVVVGKNFDPTAVKSTVKPTPPAIVQPVAVQPIDSSLTSLFRYKQRLVKFPLLIPKVVPTNTHYAEPDSTDGWLRNYALHGGQALHATMYAASSGYGSTGTTWDMQWLTWTSAPILDEATQQRIVPKKGGRLWKLFLNGANIHRIAVYYGPKRQYVVWIDNTLGDALSNKTMVAIARSLHTVPRK